MEGLWNQIDAHSPQPVIHDVGISAETEKHTDYLSPEADFHSCPSILRKNKCTGCILNVLMVLESSKLRIAY